MSHYTKKGRGQQWQEQEQTFAFLFFSACHFLSASVVYFFWLGLNGVLLWLMMKKKKSNFFFRRPMNTVIELFNHVPMSVIFNFNIFLANIHPLHTVWDRERVRKSKIIRCFNWAAPFAAPIPNKQSVQILCHAA